MAVMGHLGLQWQQTEIYTGKEIQNLSREESAVPWLRLQEYVPMKEHETQPVFVELLSHKGVYFL